MIQKTVRAMALLHAHAESSGDQKLAKIADLLHARLYEGAKSLGLPDAMLRSGGDPKNVVTPAQADVIETELDE